MAMFNGLMYSAVSAGGGVAGLSTANGGTAIADNAIIRGDGTTGIQGSTATISDAGDLVVSQDGYITRSLYIGGATTAASANVQDGSNMYLKGAYSIKWGNGLPDAYGYAGDVGLARAAAGVVKVTDGGSGDGSISVGIGKGFYETGRTSGIQIGSDHLIIVHNTFPRQRLPNDAAIDFGDGGGTWDTGLARSAAGVVKVTDGASGAGSIRVGNGSVGAPSFSFVSDTDTGLYWTTDGYIQFSTNNAGALNVGPDRVEVQANHNLLGVGTNYVQGLMLPIEANTSGSGSPNVLIGSECMKVLTNEGATAENYHTLPSAVAGYEFTFIVQDTDGIRITAAAGDTIRPIAGTAASATGGFIRCATAGAFIRLQAINATEWIATGSAGVWTIDV